MTIVTTSEFFQEIGVSVTNKFRAHHKTYDLKEDTNSLPRGSTAPHVLAFDRSKRVFVWLNTSEVLYIGNYIDYITKYFKGAERKVMPEDIVKSSVFPRRKMLNPLIWFSRTEALFADWTLVTGNKETVLEGIIIFSRGEASHIDVFTGEPLD